MRKEFLPFSRPDIGASEIAAVAAVMRSGWITTGARGREFEAAFADYCGAAGAVALSSATAGIHLFLRLLGIGPGDEVITPSLTWVAAVNLITLAGARPVFADVDRDTLMVTPETVAPLITTRTRLIIPVHFAGAPLNLRPLRELARRHGIFLLEDAAHAVGAEYRGERIGRRGNVVFSFHPSKNITCGEGGMFCSDDPKVRERLRRLRFHGLGVDAFDRTTQGRAPQAEVLEPGFKYNLTDIAAALGLGQLARLEDFIASRARLAQHYLELLAEVDEILPLQLPDYPLRHAWHLFVVRLRDCREAGERDEFMAALKARNIGTGLHFRAVHEQQYYRETLRLPRGRLPHTEWNSERILSLPLFPGMALEDVEAVVAAIKEILV